MPINDIFTRKKVLPRTFVEVLAAGLGGSWLEWEPETIKAEINRVWSVKPTEDVFGKILALQTFLKTDLFWDDILVFENIVLAFNDHATDFNTIKTCRPREIALGITLAIDLRDKTDFVQDVVEYIRACHREYGVLVYHPIVSFAQPAYEDGTRKAIAEYVQKEIAAGRPPLENVNHANPIEVQYLKAWDAIQYVEEQVADGKRVAEEAKSV